MTKLTKTDSKAVMEIVERADIYVPTPAQRRIKAEFHAALANGPSPTTISAAFAVQITGRGAIEKWWSINGFKKWFLDAISFENEAEALAGSALEVIGDVMYNAKSDKDRLAAAKLLVEIAGKVKKAQTEVKFLDDSIPDDPAKLDEYIKKGTEGNS